MGRNGGEKERGMGRGRRNRAEWGTGGRWAGAVNSWLISMPIHANCSILVPISIQHFPENTYHRREL